MTSLHQYLPKQASIDLHAPAAFDGASANFASLLRATKPVRIRMLVTPAMAKTWLETTNVNNRPLSEMHWMKIWLDIAEGRWKYNGEPISFGTNGALLNGQHRLQACAEGDTPIDTDVIFGLDPEAMSTIDIGKVRTAANIAHLEGIQNATVACAAAHLILLHENGGIQQLGNKQVEPSKTKVNERVRIDHRISDLAGRAAGLGREPRPSTGNGLLLLPFQRPKPRVGGTVLRPTGERRRAHEARSRLPVAGASAHEQRGKGKAAAPRNRGAVLQGVDRLPEWQAGEMSPLEQRRRESREVSGDLT